MAWTLNRKWLGPGESAPSGANSITVLNSANPAIAGSTIIVMLAIKPVESDVIPTVSVVDNLNGTWHQVSDSNGPVMAGGPTASSKYTIFVRLNAGGVSSITVSATGGVNPYLLAHIGEFSGGPTSGVPVWDVKAQVNPNGLTWPALTVSAGPGALVLSGGSMGVTNRTLTPSAPFAVLGDNRQSGLHNVAAFFAPTEEGQHGPTWTVATSASSLPTITAALLGADTPPAVTISVGNDLETYVGVPVEIGATAENGAGQKSFEWTSDMPGVFEDPQDSATTFTPSQTGTYTLTCTVTDDSGTASDSLLVSSLAIPTLDIVGASGWANVVGAPTALSALSDSDDNTYVESSEDPEDDILVINLPPMQKPVSDLIVPMRLSTAGGAVTVLPQLQAGDSWISAPTLSVSGDVTGYVAVWPASIVNDVTGWENGLTIRLVASV